MLWLRNASRLRRLSNEFGRVLGGAPPELRSGSLVGLEHEYVIRRRSDGRRVDFSHLVHRLRPSQAGLEPSDANAYWLPSGAVITADETEAELALPPTATRPGFSGRLVQRVVAAESWLSDALGDEYQVGQGVSTHLSVTVPRGTRADIAEHYARRWAPALMLLLDDPGAPGLLVRPRPGRLELCGEFAQSDYLRAAAIFALASTLACLAGGSGRGQPSELRLRLRPGDQRYGWFVDRRAGNVDLYKDGRNAALTTASGSTISAGQHLLDAWASARPHMTRHTDAHELELVDELVDGRRPLRVEGGAVPVAGRPPRAVADDAPAFGRALAARRRPGFEVAPVMLTWQVAVFVLADGSSGRRAFAALPARRLGRFLRLCDGGVLDDQLSSYLRIAPTRRILRDRRQIVRAGLFDGLSRRPALLAAEHALSRPGAAA